MWLWWCGGVWWWWCVWWWCGDGVVVVVVLTGELRTCLCRYDRTSMHLIGWQNTRESDSRRPRHPFPALMAGVTPGRVPVHTALKNRHASGHVINLSRTMQTAEPHRNCTVWTSQGTCVAQQRACQLLVEELQPWNLDGLLNSKTMETCLCATTGMLTTLKKNCNCGTSTVMHLSIRAYNLLQELHLWNGQIYWQHHVSRVEPSIALNTTIATKSSPRATVEPSNALNTKSSKKSSPRATVEPSIALKTEHFQQSPTEAAVD